MTQTQEMWVVVRPWPDPKKLRAFVAGETRRVAISAAVRAFNGDCLSPWPWKSMRRKLGYRCIKGGVWWGATPWKVKT